MTSTTFFKEFIGALDRVQKRISEGRIEDIDRFLKGALDSANRGAVLTHRLLAFSRRQPVDPRPINLNQVIASVEELLRRSIGETVVMKILPRDDLWLVHCDASQFENALLNLAINARDAMPNGGTLTIETANKLFDATEASQRGLAAGEFVCLQVTDTGVGMSPRSQSTSLRSLFYHQAHRQGHRAWLVHDLWRRSTI